MELRDSDEAGADVTEPERTRAEGAPNEIHVPEATQSPVEYVEAVAGLLEDRPEAAADAVGDLLAIARDETDATRVAAGEALDAIGRRYPAAFEVWTDALASAATDADDEVAFFATRAVAQLAAVNPRVAATAREAALGNLGAPTTDLRQAALSVVAEVGPLDPGAVTRADRPLAAALGDEDPGVRTAAAIAAGRLLGTAPARFPRSANALLDAVDDEDDRVRTYALVALANFANEHPSNVPRKERAIAALAGTDDDDLGLRRGATGEALAGLVSLTFEEGATTG